MCAARPRESISEYDIGEEGCKQAKGLVERPIVYLQHFFASFSFSAIISLARETSSVLNCSKTRISRASLPSSVKAPQSEIKPARRRARSSGERALSFRKLTTDMRKLGEEIGVKKDEST